MPNLTLYAAPMSSATPVLTAVAELGIDCEIVMLDLAAGEQKRPEYLKLNPNGWVPTLVVDGTPMFEAAAIMQWLGDRYGVARGLWPAADAPGRLAAASWTTWAYVSYGALVNLLNFAQSPQVDEALHHPPLAAEARRRLAALLDTLEARLGERAWLLGDDYSLADLIVASVVLYSTLCGVSVEAHPKIGAWLRQFQARESVRKTWGDPATSA